MFFNRLGRLALKLPRRVIAALFKLQIEILSFPFRILNGFYHLIVDKTLVNLQRFVQVDPLLAKEAPSNKSVQMNGEKDFDLPCNKSVQVNGEFEILMSSNPFVDVNGDRGNEVPRLGSKEVRKEPGFESPEKMGLRVIYERECEFKSPSRANLRVDRDPEFKSPCNKSSQVRRNLDFASPCNQLVPSERECDFRSPSNKSVQVNSFQGIQQKNNGKSVFFISRENNSYTSIPEINVCNEFSEKSQLSSPSCLKRLSLSDAVSQAEDPWFKPSADYERYSKMCLERNLQDVYELPKCQLDKGDQGCENVVEPIVTQTKSSGKDGTPGGKNLAVKDSGNLYLDETTQMKHYVQSSRKDFEGIGGFKDNFKSIKDSEQIPKPGGHESQNGQQVLKLSLDVLHHMVDITSQETISLKRRLASSNSKIEALLLSSRAICDEMAKINERVNRLLSLSTKIKDLQNYLCEGNMLLKEVVADRQEMNLKLDALARLIKEEEEYLDDGSIESGYEDIEMHAFSPSKQDMYNH